MLENERSYEEIGKSIDNNLKVIARNIRLIWLLILCLVVIIVYRTVNNFLNNECYTPAIRLTLSAPIEVQQLVQPKSNNEFQRSFYQDAHLSTLTDDAADIPVTNSHHKRLSDNY